MKLSRMVRNNSLKVLLEFHENRVSPSWSFKPKIGVNLLKSNPFSITEVVMNNV